MRLRSTIICGSTSFPCGGCSTSVSGPDADDELSVALSLHRPDRFEQRLDLSPFDVATGRMLEELPDGVAVVVVELRFHWRRMGSSPSLYQGATH
jgi:hypothetical protein